MIKAFVILFLITIYSGDCGEGCLKCSSENSCLKCDASSFYFKESDSCVRETIDHCYSSLQGKICLFCMAHFYYDDFTMQCLPVDKPVRNCYLYSGNSQCKNCIYGYYVKDNQCQKIPQEYAIPHCLCQRDLEKCEFCEVNKVKDIYEKHCIDIDYIEKSTHQGCKIYQSISCQECSPGYLAVSNYSYLYFQSLNDSQKNDAVDWEMILWRFNFFIESNQSQCIKITVSHCSELSAYNECRECEDGYYVGSDGDCWANPLQTISNCIEYLYYDQCRECEEGYYIHQGHCKPVTRIENCKYYYGNVSYSLCSTCVDGYSLVDNECVEDVTVAGQIYIDNCQVYNTLYENCQECESGYQLNNSQQICIVYIENCQSHYLSTDDTKVYCDQCNSGYYLQSRSSCVQGSLDNCLIYQTTANICQECVNGYYYYINICESQPNISDCLNYSHSTYGKCDQCQEGHLMFLLYNSCVDSEYLNYCDVYDAIADQCAICVSGYYTVSGKCTQISIQNCLVSSDNVVCEKCLQDYMVIEGECVKVPDSYYTDCISNNSGQIINDIQDLTCNVCEYEHLPIQMLNNYECIHTEYMETLGIKAIDHCTQYTGDKCTLCKDHYYLYENDESSECVSSCQEYQSVHSYSVVMTQQVNSLYHIYRQNICYYVNDSCRIWGPNIDSEKQEQICLMCQQGFIDVVSFSINSHSPIQIDLNKSAQATIVSNYLKPQVTCVEKEYIFVEEEINRENIYQNCLLYIVKNFLEYGCSKCRNFFTGVVGKSGYIEKCVNGFKAGADMTVYYYNLDMIWRKVFSFFECLKKDRIPFAAIRTRGIGDPTPVKYGQYHTLSVDWTEASNPAYHSIQCHENNPYALGYNSNSSLYQLPDHCALGVINLSHKDGDATGNTTDSIDSLGKLAVFCAACKPGYQSHSHSLYPYIKLQCIEIVNCNEYSVYLNTCSRCKVGFIFSYNLLTGLPDYTDCIENRVQHCQSGINRDYCQICNQGYYQLSGKCVQILSKHCSQSRTFNLYGEFTHSQTALYLQAYRDGYGCGECKASYFSLKKLTESTYCVRIDSTKIVDYRRVEQSLFIQGCQQHYLDSGIIRCSKCREEIPYNTLTEDGLHCYQLKNCQVAIDDQKCAKCSMGFGLVDFSCITSEDLYCYTYNQTNQETLQCQQCITNYLLNEEGLCIKGNVINCEYYAPFNPNRCYQCVVDHFLLSNDSMDLCVKIPTSLECSYGYLIDNQFYCIECSLANKYTVEIQSDQVQSICINREVIDNCKEYDSSSEWPSVNLQCTLCSEGYYWSNYDCVLRETVIEYCDEYQNDQEKCQLCSSGFYLTKNGSECKENLIGVENCSKYETSSECRTCDYQYYLKNNECIEVPKKSQRQHCIQYDSLFKCSQCAQGHYLSNNYCVTNNITDCLVQSSSSICLQCKENYGVVLTEPNYCLEYNNQLCQIFETQSTTGNFNCLQCVGNYYLNIDGNCKTVTQLIDFCLQYLDNGVCGVCSPTTVLSKDKLECINMSDLGITLDPYCNNSIITDPYCTACKPGYYQTYSSDSMTCIKCTDNGSYENGCFHCRSSSCLICRAGYHMTSAQKCVPDVTTLEISTEIQAHDFIWLIFFSLINY